VFAVRTPTLFPFLAALCAVAAAGAARAAPAYGVAVCTVAGVAGEYSVRVRNTGSAALPRADVAGVRLNASGQAGDTIGATLDDIPAGKYKTAVLGRRGDSVALASISTYVSEQGAETRRETLYAGKVAHVSPGSALPYTLAPLAVRGWTVAYGSKSGPALEAGSAVLLVYPARSGKKPDPLQPEAGRAPAEVVPLEVCR